MIKFLLLPSKCSQPLFFQHMISFTLKTVSTSEVLPTNALSLVICLLIVLLFLPLVAKFTHSNKPNTINQHLFFLQSFDKTRWVTFFHTFKLPTIYLHIYCPYFSAKLMCLLGRGSFICSFDIFIPLFSPGFAVSKSCKWSINIAVSCSRLCSELGDSRFSSLSKCLWVEVEEDRESHVLSDVMHCIAQDIIPYLYLTRA